MNVLEPPKVLVIDDDELALTVMRKLLEAENCSVDGATSAESALALLAQHRYDAVFCDMWMEGMTGKELYLKLKDEIPEYQRKMVFVTGDLASEATWDFIDERHLPYVLKPFSRPELRRKLREVVGEERLSAGRTPEGPAWDGQERRRFRRFGIKANVRVRRKKFSVDAPDVGSVLNASREGVLFLSDRSYRVGTEVMVAFPYTGYNDIEVDGFIVRADPLPDGRQSVAIALGEAAEVARAAFAGSEGDSRRHHIVKMAEVTPAPVAAGDPEAEKILSYQEEARRLAEELAALRATHDQVLDHRDRLATEESSLSHQLQDLSQAKQALSQTIDGLKGQMERLQLELAADEDVRYQATHDALTGLWNRGAILDILERELVRAQREGTSVGVVVADLDLFKKINDTYGHLAGDAVLREAAHRISAAVRSYDSVGRYGGEEFLIVLPGCEEDAAAQAERIRLCVGAEPVNTVEGTIPVTVSLGAATSAEIAGVDTIIRAADMALYRAKRGGRNRVELASPADLTKEAASAASSAGAAASAPEAEE